MAGPDWVLFLTAHLSKVFFLKLLLTNFWMFYMHREQNLKDIKDIKQNFYNLKDIWKKWKQPPHRHPLSLWAPQPCSHHLWSIPVSSSCASSFKAFWVQRAGACRGDHGREECASVSSSITSVSSGEVIQVIGMRYSKWKGISAY